MTQDKEILANPVYLPESGMRQHLHESLMKLSGQDLAALALIISCKPYWERMCQGSIPFVSTYQERTMYQHTVEVKLSFVETKEKNGKGNFIKRPVVHRKMYLDGPADIFGICRWRVVMVRRKGEAYFSTSYIPAPKKSAWWDTVGIPYTEFVREKEPNGKVTPAYDLEGILQWLKHRVTDPVAVLSDLLTAVPVKAELEEAA